MSDEIEKLLTEKIRELYDSMMEKPLQVLDIFNNFFGEERVDMQEYMNFEEFKSWMYSLELYMATNIIRYTNISMSEWELYKRVRIDKLPEFMITKIFSNLESVKEKVGVLLNRISILVHFPHVRITNENNKFVDITHLWAKVRFSYKGALVGTFGLNRSEYPISHLRSDYLHSHVNGIMLNNLAFQVPCTGIGPINSTMSSLNMEYDEDLWNLFCLELSKYVTVESIEGGPYRYLEKIHTNEFNCIKFFSVFNTSPYNYTARLPKDRILEFVTHFINTKKLRFNYKEGSYAIGMSLPEYITLISNEFISWYNDMYNKKRVTVPFTYLENEGLLKLGIIKDGVVYVKEYNSEAHTDYSQYVGKKICTFKGKDITLNIIDDDHNGTDNYNIILNPTFALYILSKILKVLNYRYGREREEGNKANTEVRYL